MRANPSRRRRSRRRSYRRNPAGFSVGKWLLAGALGVVTMGATAILSPVVLPASVLASPMVYGGILAGLGTAAGMALAYYDQPTLAIGIGFPIFILGAFSFGTGLIAKLSAPADSAPVLNPARRYADRKFADVHAQRGFMGAAYPHSMGAVEAYRPQMGMGAVYPYGSIAAVWPGMGAVEAMVGDRSSRPMVYQRAGYQLGAR